MSWHRRRALPGPDWLSDRAGSNDIFNAVNSPSVTANGQRGSSNGFYVDDTSVNDNPDEGGAKLSPNPDSVQEVRVSVNNYSGAIRAEQLRFDADSHQVGNEPASWQPF